MPWILPCPACDHPTRPRPGSEGTAVRCPSCLHRIDVPAKRPPPDPPPPPPARPMPPRPAPARPDGGFWRWVAVGVGAVALVAVVGLGVRGLWPTPPAPIPPPGPIAMGRGGTPIPMPVGGWADGPRENVLGFPPDIAVKLDRNGAAALPATVGLPPFVALAGATKAGLLLLGTADGELLAYRAADLSPAGRAVLDRPATFLALDEARGRLYSCAAHLERLRNARLAERDNAPADVAVYDVSGLLAGTMPPGTRLEPTGRHPRNGTFAGLALSPDGRWLHFASEEGAELVAGRIEAETLLPGPTKATGLTGNVGMTLSPDGKRLYVLAGGRLTGYDPDGMREVGSVLLGSSPNSPVADDAGRVFLLDRRPTNQVLVLDFPARRPVARWDLSLEGRPSLARSPDGRRVYFGASGVLAGQVWEIDGSGDRPAVGRAASSDRDRLLRGPVFVSPAGRVLLGNGVVLGGV